PSSIAWHAMRIAHPARQVGDRSCVSPNPPCAPACRRSPHADICSIMIDRRDNLDLMPVQGGRLAGDRRAFAPRQDTSRPDLPHPPRSSSPNANTCFGPVPLNVPLPQNTMPSAIDAPALHGSPTQIIRCEFTSSPFASMALRGRKVSDTRNLSRLPVVAGDGSSPHPSFFLNAFVDNRTQDWQFCLRIGN